MIHTYIITIPEVATALMVIVGFGAVAGWFMCSLFSSMKIGDLEAAVCALKEWNADLVAVIAALKQPRGARGQFVKREAR